MNEGRNVDIKILGGLNPAQHDIAVARVEKVQSELSREALAKFPPVKLTPEQTTQVREVEGAAREHITAKMRRLGVSEDKIPYLPPVHYGKKQGRNDDERSGYYDYYNNIPVVLVDSNLGDFFDVLKVIPHELAHSSVRREVRLYFSEKPLESAYAQGMEVVGGQRKKASGIEEGMTYMDEVDFFNTYLKEKYPQKYEKRREWSGSDRLKEEVGKIDQTLYGLLTPDILTPFVAAVGPNLKLLGKSLQGPLINTKLAVKEFLFARKLCEIVGRNAANSENAVDVDTEEAISRGRDILDRDRFLRTGDAHRAIVKALGGKNAKAVFALGAHDEEHIDDAMRILVNASLKPAA